MTINIIVTLSGVSAAGIVAWLWWDLMTKWRKPEPVPVPEYDALSPYDDGDVLAPGHDGDALGR